MKNQVLEKLRAGGSVGVVWASLGSPAVAELMAEAEPDACVLDLQHGLFCLAP